MTPPEEMKFLFSAGTLIVSIRTHPVKTSPISVTCGLSVTLVRFGQAENNSMPSEMDAAEDSGKTNSEMPVPIKA